MEKIKEKDLQELIQKFELTQKSYGWHYAISLSEEHALEDLPIDEYGFI